MNEVQSYIIKNLNYSLRGNKMDIPINTQINWNELIEECRQHQISSLLYYGISKNSLKSIDNNIVENWKKETFMSGVYQINHIKQISKVLSIFNENNIPVIVLKGLVVRELYPKSELRTMCDADILVHEEDLDNVINIIKEEGYIEYSRNNFHIAFSKGNSLIEVHWTLVNEDMFDGISEFKDEIWRNAVEVNVGDSMALSMCDEDLLIYLCLHMANHIKNSGFGIRQICDVFLTVEKKSNNINWSSFIDKAKILGIYKFSLSIFAMCNKLFEMNIPKEIEVEVKIDEKYFNLLLDNIFSSGVHGHKDRLSTIVKSFGMGNEKINSKDKRKSIYFPDPYRLGDRYMYAKNNKVLLPIAWMHRIIRAVFHEKFSLSDKIKMYFTSRYILKNHRALLDWLEL